MGKSNETTVLTVYVSNQGAGWILHNVDLVNKHKTEIRYQLKLLLEQMKKD